LIFFSKSLRLLINQGRRANKLGIVIFMILSRLLLESLRALEIKASLKQPWGKIVSYVRYPDEMLIELCTPVT